MSDMMSIGANAVTAYQQALSTVSNNIANANTEGYSTETTNLAKSQIISQAATAMLAQANQSAQNVLALLK